MKLIRSFISKYFLASNSTDLIQFGINLPMRCILNLPVYGRHEVLQIWLISKSGFKSSLDLINFTTISMQTKFSHVIRFKVALYSPFFLRGIFSIVLTVSLAACKTSEQSQLGWKLCVSLCPNVSHI